MSDEVFERAVEEFAKMGGGHFGFLPVVGEPGMDPALLSRVKRVRDLPWTTQISMTTNGILLDRFGIREILQSGVNSISVSTSGFEEPMYQRVFGSNPYKRMLANVTSLLEMNRELGDPVYIEIEVRADRPIREVVRSEDFQRIGSLTEHIHFLRRFDNWGGLVKQRDLSGSMTMRERKRPSLAPCKGLLWAPMIFANGEVGACTCRDPHHAAAFHLDSILTDKLEDMWFGHRRHALFTSFMVGLPPWICHHCSHYVGWESTLFNVGNTLRDKVGSRGKHGDKG